MFKGERLIDIQKNVNVGIVGFGNVGRTLTKLILESKSRIYELGFNINVKFICDSKGCIVDFDKGLSEDILSKHLT